jgi:uncharacterized protein (DUF2164 family)
VSIELSRESRERAITSITEDVEENLGVEIGDLKASLLLQFFLKEIAPWVYNQAVVDAQAWMQPMVSEIDGTCHEPEFGFWKR